MGLVAPRHVGSSQTRARTHVPCIGRQILNHCATREVPDPVFLYRFFHLSIYLPALSADLLILRARVGGLARGTSVFDTVPWTSLLFETFIIVCLCIIHVTKSQLCPPHTILVRFRNFINAWQIVIQMVAAVIVLRPREDGQIEAAVGFGLWDLGGVSKSN